MKSVNFQKYQGIGNDFILIDAITNPHSLDLNKFTIDKVTSLCHRNYGIGSDGIILVLPSKILDFSIKILNSDGSEAEMCGNGIRCVIKFILDNDIVSKKDKYLVETKAGKIEASVEENFLIKVNMGTPVISPKEIPVSLPLDKNGIASGEININDIRLKVFSIGMGNPHAVIYVNSLETVKLKEWGELIENYNYFPLKTNVHFVHIHNRNQLNVLVWERGCGPTLACGTGACACLAISSLLDRSDNRANVNLPGGTLEIYWPNSEGNIFMTGEAQYVFSGRFLV